MCLFAASPNLCCPRCRLAAHLSQWQADFPWLELVSLPSCNTLSLSCSCCRTAGVSGAWGQGRIRIGIVRTWLRRHAVSKKHKLAQTKINGEAVVHDGQTLMQGHVVPSTESLVKICLGEAYRELHRKFMLKAEAISIHQDGRKGHILMRFTASDVACNVRSGVFGSVDHAAGFRQSSEGIRDASMAIIDRFCSRGYFAPYLRGKRVAEDAAPVHVKPNKRLKSWILNHIELFDADAAPDEQLAGRFLKKPMSTSVDDYQTSMPNIKVFNKDTAHASRRISTRTAKVDDFMKEVQTKYYQGRKSIAQLIQHSRVFAERFLANNSRMEAKHGGSRIKNLRAAKHRFESYQKPLGRSVLFHKGLLLTAEQIANERSGLKEGKAAAEFLDFVSEQAQLQLALMADGFDEAMIFTRYNDNENFDKTQLQDEAYCFVDRVSLLFEKGECWRYGYTKFMLGLLEDRTIKKHIKTKQIIEPTTKNTIETSEQQPQLT